MTTVEAHSCLLYMHVTFDLAEIKELMPQQARKQLEAELEKSCCSLGGVHCLYTAILVSPVQSSTVQSSPVHSPAQSRVQVLQRPSRYCTSYRCVSTDGGFLPVFSATINLATT